MDTSYNLKKKYDIVEIRRLFYFALTVALFMLSACGDSDDDTVTNTKQTQIGSDTSDSQIDSNAQVETEDDEKDDAQTDDDVVIITSDDNAQLAEVLYLLVEGVTLDSEGNALITQDVIDTITELDVSNQGLTSLSGIENFVNITYLDCSDNYLETLDISELINLETLICSRCFIHVETRTYSDGTLDLSDNTELVNLYCDENNLTELNISQNAKLEVLECQNNYLTELYVSANTVLTTIKCYKNLIQYLDISMLTSLGTLLCGVQTDITMNLSVNSEQEAKWESVWKTEEFNADVNLLRDVESSSSIDNLGNGGVF